MNDGTKATSEAAMTDISRENASPSVRVWDIAVRVFHWGVVGAVAVAWLAAEEIQPVHEFAGYTVAGLVAFRLVWGVIGTRYARFGRFVKGPRGTMAYLGDIAHGRERRYLGHNPAGAAMIVALLLTLSGTAFTGWLMAEPDRVALLPTLPPIVASAHADEDGEHGEYGGRAAFDGPLKEVHETLATLVLVLAGLHLAGVALASLRHHENLPRAMLTGQKRPPGPGDIA